MYTSTGITDRGLASATKQDGRGLSATLKPKGVLDEGVEAANEALAEMSKAK